MVEFYEAAIDSQTDVIYLGETVCSKRTELTPNEWLELAEGLQDRGKQIVLSTQTLLETPADHKLLQRYCDNDKLLFEANDMGAVGILSNKRLPFVVGAAINCYNAHTLQQLRQLGMQRWVMPVELSRQWLLDVISEAKQLGCDMGFEREVFAYGYLPLAYSARCFTSRHENRPKSDCQQCCIQYPQGLTVNSQEGQALFTINGIQTQSGYCYNLINDIPSMQGLVDIVRISPLSLNSLETAEQFKRTAELGLTDNIATGGECNGYWHNLTGMTMLNTEQQV
ncbi:collagenase-like PrtC family protease [Sinobacterium caligoides]|uniref:Collagenase-like PrtC family protease n=2 Tax=Sinobacterium caligoides TaxID=933926 RepID=A0A3N2DYV3_9GAMM|nr:collagenase-like PrtC family protease [Sinobacterium caligoides]